MSHTIIDLPPVGDDGRLYRDTALNFVESLIPNPWNSCHAPDLLELENGDLLCCWFAGSCEGNADVSIAVSRLSEDSSQWETPVIVSDDPTRSEQNPSLFLHPNGEIWLMYTAQFSRDPNNPTSDNLQGKFPAITGAPGRRLRQCFLLPARSAGKRFRFCPTDVLFSTISAVRSTIPAWETITPSCSFQTTRAKPGVAS